MPEFHINLLPADLVGECPICQKPFPKTKGWRKYCSVRCSRKAEWQRLKDRDHKERGVNLYQKITTIENPTLDELQVFIKLAQQDRLPTTERMVHFSGKLPDGFTPPKMWDGVTWCHHPKGEIEGAPEYWSLAPLV